MFDKAKEKIKNWWANPYWAPVTEPFKMIGGAAWSVDHEFIEKTLKALDDKNYRFNKEAAARPKLARMFQEWRSLSTSTWINLSAELGPVVGGLAAGALAGIALGGAGFGVVAIAAGSIAACALGAVATPFAIMATVGFAGACVGLAASPWGVCRGVMKAFKHHQLQKTQAGLVQATPALQAASPDAQATATRIFSQLRDLPAELQAPVLKSLSESFAATGTGATDRIMKSIEALPDADRKALVTELQKELATAFDAVATEQAQDSITLQEAAATMPALRFKKR